MAKNNKERVMLLRQLADDLENEAWYLGEFNEFEGKDFDYYYKRMYMVYSEHKSRVDRETLNIEHNV